MMRARARPVGLEQVCVSTFSLVGVHRTGVENDILHARMCMHTPNIHTHTHIHTHVHTRTNTDTYTHRHTHVRSHPYTHIVY